MELSEMYRLAPSSYRKRMTSRCTTLLGAEEVYVSGRALNNDQRKILRNNDDSFALDSLKNY